MSNVDKWSRWYDGVTLDEPQTYGDETTYRMGVQWLKDCDPIYDLGCGKGGFTKVARDMGAGFRIIGVDGSDTPFADITTDLVDLKINPAVVNPTSGVFMRHVLEHDYRWEKILNNAVRLCTKRLFLVLFTPLQDETREIAWNEDPGVPDIGFNLRDILRVIGDNVTIDGRKGTIDIQTDISTNTQYGSETIIAVNVS